MDRVERDERVETVSSYVAILLRLTSLEGVSRCPACCCGSDAWGACMLVASVHGSLNAWRLEDAAEVLGEGLAFVWVSNCEERAPERELSTDARDCPALFAEA